MSSWAATRVPLVAARATAENFMMAVCVLLLLLLLERRGELARRKRVVRLGVREKVDEGETISE